MSLREAMHEAVTRASVSSSSMTTAMTEILEGKATDAEIAAFAVAMKMKGENASELAAAATVLRAHAEQPALGLAPPLLDTCGTGGDGLSTFNISTLAAIVAAACGVQVVKHGNRSVSSRCGSADLLQALGLRLELSAAEMAACLQRTGICFLLAPAHHRALRHAAAARRQLPFPTLFNLLGPLVNPAGATHQLLGVYEAKWVTILAEALQVLGIERAWVVHGAEGLDEVSPCGPTDVVEVDRGELRAFVLSPQDFGLEAIDAAQLRGGDAATNAAAAWAILQGEAGGLRQAVVINAAAALCIVQPGLSPSEAARRAAGALDGGAAANKLQEWIACSHRTSIT